MEISSNVAQVLIRDSQIVSEAYSNLCDIDKLFDEKINNITGGLVKKEGWILNKKGWFYPKSWPTKNGNPLAYYEIGCSKTLLYWFMCVTGVENCKAGFALVIEPNLLSVDAYSDALETFYNDGTGLNGGSLIPFFDGKGIRQSYLVFPFAYSLDELAENYPDWDGLSARIEKSFSNLVKAHTLIDAFIRRLNQV